MTTKPKDADAGAPKGDDGKGGPPADAGGDDDDDDDGQGGGDLTRGDLRDMIREELKGVVDELKGVGAPKGDDDGKGGPPAGRRTLREDEDHVRSLVEQAVGSIRKDEEIVGRLGKIEAKVLVETPPAHVPWLRRVLHGSAD